ncbi:acyl-CoA dehydrogenase [Marinobacterium nitratireducens]|uniref:Acyl-CoA dehydrogenase n=1 Tax=Marinobacterium nitratireducens TaxID=518897 RepID=A0A917ZB20_9GAMM|nr:isovaleryl-CoA dehydrogenase [Marinobacterium nitratireducens]GGO79810.1 acyl-CoA dehydrogenase [Marinobacterium nitratireducens]
MTDSRYLAETHEVLNQAPILTDYNLYRQDRALVEAVAREGAGRASDALSAFGALAGSSQWIEWGFQANENKPVLHTHDIRGNRRDEVRFHPAYHQLMKASIEHGLHASHWRHPGPGAQVERAAKFYLMTQVEAGHLCPISMTSAAIPALRRQPEVFEQWAPKIMAREYDSRNVPDAQKPGLTIGMAMTEKQGGSDVRANTTRAYPLDTGGPGQAYELVGHKYFVSAPMSDAYLVLAQAPGGLSCFLLPRWRPDGSKNPLQIQRLKNKMGNVANASSETELRGAWALMIGEEGRGVPTIIEMVAMTRFDCMIGSSAGMRQAVAQATHHAAHRSAFGKRLADQPLMRNVLADLAIEHEAALMMTMRIARALDGQAADEHEKQLVRLGTAVGKYWICKRTPGHAYEAMECIGGMGLMEDCIMPRLLRESPVNSIWEGSGNVQCLDVLRAMGRDPGILEAFAAEIRHAAGGNRHLDLFMAKLQAELADRDDFELRARSLVEKMALAMQGSLLVRFGDSAVADAFCASRLNPEVSGLVYGNLPRGVDVEAIVQRATPRL